MTIPGTTLEKSATPVNLANLEKLASLVDETDLELLPFFEEEAKAEIKIIEAELQAWHGPNAGCPLSKLRVHLHTLKGAANSIGQLRIGSLVGALKEVLDTYQSEELFARRPEVTKVTVLVVEAIRALMKEARAPQFNPVKADFIAKVVKSILDLSKKSEEPKSP